MAMTVGTIAASATPATDFYTQISTVLTNAGWTNRSDMSAATGGTTAVNKVWTSPSTTVASSIYTGCIIFIEVDDTNSRLRIRAVEKYDSSAVGSPASSVKWACGGYSGSSNNTVTANGAASDSFVALFQAAGATQLVAWIEIPCSGSGFNYWIGANAYTLLVANNSSGTYNVMFGGHLRYQGDVNTSLGNAVVYMGGSELSNTSGTYSWTRGNTTGTSWGSVRWSREPGLAAASYTGALAGHISGPMLVSNGAMSNSAYGGLVAGGNQFYTETYILFPAWLHAGGTAGALVEQRGPSCTNYATVPEFAVYLNTRRGQAANVTRSDIPSMGETITQGGTTWTFLAVASTGGLTTSGGGRAQVDLWVDGSQF